MNDSVNDELGDPEQRDGQNGRDDTEHQTERDDGTSGLPDNAENSRNVSECGEPLPPRLLEVRLSGHCCS